MSYTDWTSAQQQALQDELANDPLAYGINNGQPDEMADGEVFLLLNAVYEDSGSAPDPNWFRDRKRATISWAEVVEATIAGDSALALLTLTTVNKSVLMQMLQDTARMNDGLLDISTNQTFAAITLATLFPNSGDTAAAFAALVAERREPVSRWVELGLPPGSHLDIAQARGRV